MNPSIDLYYNSPRQRFRERLREATRNALTVTGCILFAPVVLVLALPAIVISKSLEVVRKKCLPALRGLARLPEPLDPRSDVPSTPIEWTTTFYGEPWLSHSGELISCVSSYADNGSHMSGFEIIAPDTPDFTLWLWVTARWKEISEAGGPRWLMSNHELERLRPQFEAERQLAASDKTFRERLLAQVPVIPEPTEEEQKLWRRRRRSEALETMAFEAIFEVFVEPPLSLYMWARDRVRVSRRK